MSLVNSHSVKLLAKYKRHEKCPMCKRTESSLRYQWIGMITGDRLEICRECAYREAFGSKGRNAKKKEKVLDKME